MARSRRLKNQGRRAAARTGQANRKAEQEGDIPAPPPRARKRTAPPAKKAAPKPPPRKPKTIGQQLKGGISTDVRGRTRRVGATARGKEEDVARAGSDPMAATSPGGPPGGRLPKKPIKKVAPSGVKGRDKDGKSITGGPSAPVNAGAAANPEAFRSLVTRLKSAHPRLVAHLAQKHGLSNPTATQLASAMVARVGHEQAMKESGFAPIGAPGKEPTIPDPEPGRSAGKRMHDRYVEEQERDMVAGGWEESPKPKDYTAPQMPVEADRPPDFSRYEGKPPPMPVPRRGKSRRGK